MTPEERLALDLALLDAEVALLEELDARGIVPADARRQPTAGELRAGVRFSELDRIVEEAAQLVARKADRVRTALLDGLAEVLSPAMGEEDPYVALARLVELADPTHPEALPGLRQLIDDVSAEIEADLLEAARQGGAQVLDEATRQGLPARLLPDVDPIDDTVRAAAKAAAQRVATQPVTRLLGVALEAGQRAAQRADASGYDVVADAIDAAESTPADGTVDQARQAANSAHGLGRTNVAKAAPEPREVYASELLDRNTCGPCGEIDGRTYVNLEAALVDYPGAGGYVECEGGARCRGTLVLVWDTESTPTLDGPGDGRRGGDGHTPDRTPRGPATGGPRPDPGVSPTPSTGALLVDSSGTVTAPRTIEAEVPAPVEPDAPTAPPVDPELEQLTTAELNRQLRDPNLDQAARLRAADELDRRDAGTSAYRNPDADPGWADFDLEDTAGDVVDYGELEALQAATFEDEARNLGVVTGKPGRRIDHVREAFDLEAHRFALDAEAATKGILIRRDRLEEFRAKYGSNTDVLFTGPARIGYYYASEELRGFWHARPRTTFAEFAVDSGISDAKTVARAKAAREARDEAILRAEEDPAKREQRKREADAERRRRDHNRNSAGRQLERAQRRAAAERRRAERIARDLGDTGGG